MHTELSQLLLEKGCSMKDLPKKMEDNDGWTDTHGAPSYQYEGNDDDNGDDLQL